MIRVKGPEREMIIAKCTKVVVELRGLVVVKQVLSLKMKMSVYQSIYLPILTYGHMLRAVEEMRFLHRVAGLILCDMELDNHGRL